MSSQLLFAKSYNPAFDGFVVKSFCICGTTSVQTTHSGPEVYHWRYYLQFGSGVRACSVVIDSIPGADARTAVLSIASIDTVGTITKDKVEHVVAAVKPATVREIIDFLIAEDLHKYRYDETGSGCRWWCTVLLRHLEKKLNVVAPGSSTAFETFMAALAQKQPIRVPMPTRKGTFYGNTNENLVRDFRFCGLRRN